MQSVWLIDSFNRIYHQIDLTCAHFIMELLESKTSSKISALVDTSKYVKFGANIDMLRKRWIVIFSARTVKTFFK